MSMDTWIELLTKKINELTKQDKWYLTPVVFLGGLAVALLLWVFGHYLSNKLQNTPRPAPEPSSADARAGALAGLRNSETTIRAEATALENSLNSAKSETDTASAAALTDTSWTSLDQRNNEGRK